MTAPLVLVVDDDSAVRRTLGLVLGREGYRVAEAPDGREALRRVHDERPDLVILDVAMPELDGWQTLARIRDVTDTPVLMLSAMDSEASKVQGLTAGADDYVGKPVGKDELLARVQALLRRSAVRHVQPTTEVYVVGDLRLDAGRRTVLLGGVPLGLTKVEFDLLAALMQAPTRVHTRDELLERITGSPIVGDAHRLDIHISNLRSKLGDDARRPRYIETVRGVGFRVAS